MKTRGSFGGGHLARETLHTVGQVGNFIWPDICEHPKFQLARKTNDHLIDITLSAAVVITTKAQPGLGVYDYAQTFIVAKNISYEQIWDWWDACATRTGYSPNSKPLRNVAELQFVCVEPWPISSITPNKADLLSDIIYGKYDNVIRTIAADIKKYNAPVVVCWGHEKPRPVTRGLANSLQRTFQRFSTSPQFLKV